MTDLVTFAELEAAETVTAAVIAAGGSHEEIRAAVEYEMSLADQYVDTNPDAELDLDVAAAEYELCIELELEL